MSFSKLICPMNDDARHIIRGLELEAEWLREHVSSLNQTWKVEREHNNNLENQLSDMQNQLGWETENRGAARKELHAVKQQLHAVKQELYAVKRELAKSRKEVKSVEEDRSWLNAVLDSVRKEMNEVKGKWKKAEAELRRVHRVGQVKFGRVRDVLPAADSHIIRVESDSVFGAK